MTESEIQAIIQDSLKTFKHYQSEKSFEGNCQNLDNQHKVLHLIELLSSEDVPLKMKVRLGLSLSLEIFSHSQPIPPKACVHVLRVDNKMEYFEAIADLPNDMLCLCLTHGILEMKKRGLPGFDATLISDLCPEDPNTTADLFTFRLCCDAVLHNLAAVQVPLLYHFLVALTTLLQIYSDVWFHLLDTSEREKCLNQIFLHVLPFWDSGVGGVPSLVMSVVERLLNLGLQISCDPTHLTTSEPPCKGMLRLLHVLLAKDSGTKKQLTSLSAADQRQFLQQVFTALATNHTASVAADVLHSVWLHAHSSTLTAQLNSLIVDYFKGELQLKLPYGNMHLLECNVVQYVLPLLCQIHSEEDSDFNAIDHMNVWRCLGVLNLHHSALGTHRLWSALLARAVSNCHENHANLKLEPLVEYLIANAKVFRGVLEGQDDFAGASSLQCLLGLPLAMLHEVCRSVFDTSSFSVMFGRLLEVFAQRLLTCSQPALRARLLRDFQMALFRRWRDPCLAHSKTLLFRWTQPYTQTDQEQQAKDFLLLDMPGGGGNFYTEDKLEDDEVPLCGLAMESVLHFTRSLIESEPLFPGSNYQRQKSTVDVVKVCLDALYCQTPTFGAGGTLSKEAQKKLVPLMVGLVRHFGWEPANPRAVRYWLSSLVVVNREVQAEIVKLLVTLSINMTEDSAALGTTGLSSTELDWQHLSCLLHSPQVTLYNAGAHWLTLLFRSVVKSNDSTLVTVNHLLENTLVDFSCSILRISQQRTGHGYRLCLLTLVRDAMCGAPHVKCPHSEDPLLSHFLNPSYVEKVLNVTQSISTLMGAKQLDVASSPSFAALGEAILRAAEDDTTKLDTEEDEQKLRLTPEYQHVLTWAWTTMSTLCEVMEIWVEVSCRMSHPNVETMKVIGLELVRILLTSRHRGTIESVSKSLNRYSHHVFKWSTTSCDKASKQHEMRHFVSNVLLMEKCLQRSLHEKTSVTRRSAGLPLLVNAILLASTSALPGTSGLVHECVQLLMKECEASLSSIHKLSAVNSSQCDDTGPSTNQEAEYCDPQGVLALNLLRHLVRDASLVSPMLTHLAPLALLALRGLADADWCVRNAALQLFSSLLSRLVGAGAAESTPRMSLVELAAHYPSLLPGLVDYLRDALSECDNGSSSPHQQHAMCMAPLALLSRVTACGRHCAVNGRTADILLDSSRKSLSELSQVLWHLMHCSPLSGVRHLACEVFRHCIVPLCADEDMRVQLWHRILTVNHNLPNNSSHGDLLLMQDLVQISSELSDKEVAGVLTLFEVCGASLDRDPLLASYQMDLLIGIARELPLTSTPTLVNSFREGIRALWCRVEDSQMKMFTGVVHHALWRLTLSTPFTVHHCADVLSDVVKSSSSQCLRLLAQGLNDESISFTSSPKHLGDCIVDTLLKRCQQQSENNILEAVLSIWFHLGRGNWPSEAGVQTVMNGPLLDYLTDVLPSSPEPSEQEFWWSEIRLQALHQSFLIWGRLSTMHHIQEDPRTADVLKKLQVVCISSLWSVTQPHRDENARLRGWTSVLQLLFKTLVQDEQQCIWTLDTEHGGLTTRCREDVIFLVLTRGLWDESADIRQVVSELASNLFSSPKMVPAMPSQTAFQLMWFREGDARLLSAFRLAVRVWHHVHTWIREKEANLRLYRKNGLLFEPDEMNVFLEWRCLLQLAFITLRQILHTTESESSNDLCEEQEHMTLLADWWESGDQMQCVATLDAISGSASNVVRKCLENIFPVKAASEYPERISRTKCHEGGDISDCAFLGRLSEMWRMTVAEWVHK